MGQSLGINMSFRTVDAKTSDGIVKANGATVAVHSFVYWKLLGGENYKWPLIDPRIWWTTSPRFPCAKYRARTS